MEIDEIIKHAEVIRARVANAGDATKGPQAEATDFLLTYAGAKSSFYRRVNDATGIHARRDIVSIMDSFINYVSSGLLAGISIERKAQIDVVSDFLEQANHFLENKKFHPAAAALLIGATLEEFLRNWVEAENISIGNRNPSIDSYATALKESDFITKQDIKDITSWAGVRNHAAHGEWEEVSDRQRIGLMLEGVNLFMRKYSERT